MTAKDNEKEKKNASKSNELERGKREERLMEYNARIESTCLYWTACCCCKTHNDKNKILYVSHVNCIEVIENGMRMYTSLTIPLKSLGMQITFPKKKIHQISSLPHQTWNDNENKYFAGPQPKLHPQKITINKSQFLKPFNSFKIQTAKLS